MIALAAMVVGCGGDSEDASAGGEETFKVYASTTVTTAGISKAQFVPRVNKICREAWKIIVDNFHVYSSTQDPTLSKRERTREAIQLSLLAGLDFHIFDEIRILGAPRGEETTIEEMIGSFQASVEKGQQNPTADSLKQVPARFADYNQRAGQYGLNDCLVDPAHLGRIKPQA